jgi:hypothetical protein
MFETIGRTNETDLGGQAFEDDLKTIILSLVASNI